MKQRIINYFLKYLLCSVSPEDIIYTINPQESLKVGKPAGLYLGSELISPEELKMMKQEAIALENMKIWTVMQETIRADAMKRGFENATSFDDLKTCKLMLYNLDIINSTLKVIRNKK